LRHKWFGVTATTQSLPEFVVNLRDCKGLGLTIPSMLGTQGEASLSGLKA